MTDGAAPAAFSGKEEEIAPSSSANALSNDEARPLCLLIPAPVTDLDDLAALLRFVATAQPVMARTVDEVPTTSRVLVIGVTSTEEWREIEDTFDKRKIPYQRVTKRLSEAFANLPQTGL